MPSRVSHMLTDYYVVRDYIIYETISCIIQHLLTVWLHLADDFTGESASAGQNLQVKVNVSCKVPVVAARWPDQRPATRQTWPLNKRESLGFHTHLPEGTQVIWPPLRLGLSWCWCVMLRTAAAVWQLLSLFAGTLTFHRQLVRSHIPVSHVTPLSADVLWNTYLQRTGHCTANSPNQRADSTAQLPYKAAVDAQAPDVTGKDGCLAQGESWALSSLIHQLISKFKFYCSWFQVLR